MHSSTNTDKHPAVTPARDDDEQSAQSGTDGTSADVKAPFASHEDDDSAVGDTDQHSTA